METGKCKDCKFYSPVLTRIPSFWNPHQGCELMKYTGRHGIIVNGNCLDFKEKNNTKGES